jgi:NAD(P)-dependent dehydrogenase (short-subunit alcohol dehydrogenase family)
MISRAHLADGGPETLGTPRTWMVVGASSGIGRAVAEQVLRRPGDRLVAASRDIGRMSDLLAQAADRVQLYKVDVRRPAMVRDAVANAVESFGSIDVVVSCAGTCLVGAVEECSDEEIRDMMETNFFGVVNIVAAIVPYFRARRHGQLAVVTSNGAFDGLPGCGAYCASKAAANSLLEAVAAEAGPTGVLVTMIEPGLVRTGMRERGTVRAGRLIADYDLTCDTMRRTVGQPYPDEAGDVARAAQAIIRALVSDPPPRHLPLGEDAVNRIRGKLERLSREITEWQDLALSVRP